MERFKKTLPYLAVNALCFYLFPLFMQDTGSAMTVMLTLLPVATIACALAAATKHGFCWPYPLCVAVLFVPSIFLFYNSSAWFYSLLFGALALIGCFFGWLVFKLARPKDHTLRR